MILGSWRLPRSGPGAWLAWADSPAFSGVVCLSAVVWQVAMFRPRVQRARGTSRGGYGIRGSADDRLLLASRSAKFRGCPEAVFPVRPVLASSVIVDPPSICPPQGRVSSEGECGCSGWWHMPLRCSSLSPSATIPTECRLQSYPMPTLGQCSGWRRRNWFGGHRQRGCRRVRSV